MPKSQLGKDLIKGLEELLDHEQGKVTLKTTERQIPMPAPQWTKRDIKKIRKSLGVSQPVLAEFLNVKTPTIKAWEQGQKQPSGAASRLLQILANQPEAFGHPAILNQKKVS